ncbi:MAG: hypothetical protein AUG51_05995 [Acidobacteria bacterium 13_1_20CM_3_53_8]|nr:MAG: hypothetical protein AUG51_05995 [Acidobacteria bacterium 13_1_20CM_3_53_8]
MFTKALKLTLLILALLASSVMPRAQGVGQYDLTFAQHGTQNSVQEELNNGDSTWTWKRTDTASGERIEVRVVETVEFTEDYADIKSIGQGGSIRIEETRGGETRRFEAWRDSAGQVQREYRVNHETRSMDADGRAWLAKLLLQAVRRGGLDASARAGRMLRRGGASAVLAEISQLEGDYVKRIYFGELIKNGQLTSGVLQTVLRQAAHELKSDYELAQLLIEAGTPLAGSDQALVALFEASQSIKSDYERRRVLTAMAKKSLSRAAGAQLLKSLATISSDYEKATFLSEYSTQFLTDAELRAAYFQIVSTIKSDYEHHRVLSSLLKNRGLSEATLREMLRSASAIQSDYEKASFLIESSSLFVESESLRPLFFNVVKTIQSDYERTRVISNLSRKHQIAFTSYR